MASDLAPDWILQETLAIQAAAGQEFRNTHPHHKPISAGGPAPTTAPAINSATSPDSDLVLSIIDNGTLGPALLEGFLKVSSTSSASPSHPMPTHFQYCTTRPDQLSQTRAILQSPNVTVHATVHAAAVRAASIVLLGGDSAALRDLLADSEMTAGLRGKQVLVCTSSDPLAAQVLQMALHSDLPGRAGGPTIIRVVPNTAAAAAAGEGLAVFGEPLTPLPDATHRLLTSLFESVGRVVRVPAASVDASVALCAAGPALTAVLVESLAARLIADGAVSPRDAYAMAAQSVRGATGLILDGETHPAVVRDRIVGSSREAAKAMMAVEEQGTMRSAVVRAVNVSMATTELEASPSKTALHAH